MAQEGVAGPVGGLKNRAEIHGALLKERADVAQFRGLLDGRLAGLARFVAADGLLELQGAGLGEHAVLLIDQREAMETAAEALRAYSAALDRQFELVQAEALRDGSGVDIDAAHRRG